MLKHLVAAAALLAVINGQSLPFASGEKLTYTARFNVLPVGEATLSVINDTLPDSSPAYHIIYRARTGEMADRLFKIRDRIDTWFDKEDLYTRRIQKDIREGKYRHKSTTDIFYSDSIAVTGKDTIKIQQPVRDPYSLVYYLRTLPMKVNQTINLVTFDNKKKTDFQLKITGLDNVQVPAGKFSCLVIKPFREKRILFKNEGDMEVWLSNDEKRIPVQINIKLKYGSMVLKLKEVATKTIPVD